MSYKEAPDSGKPKLGSHATPRTPTAATFLSRWLFSELRWLGRLRAGRGLETPLWSASAMLMGE